ncbi:hypothetical protein ACKWTF_015931 [Chironomus riparius]
MVEQLEMETGRISRLVKNKITWIVVVSIIAAFTLGYFLGRNCEDRNEPPRYYPPMPQYPGART